VKLYLAGVSSVPQQETATFAGAKRRLMSFAYSNDMKTAQRLLKPYTINCCPHITNASKADCLLEQDGELRAVFCNACRESGMAINFSIRDLSKEEIGGLLVAYRTALDR